MQWPFWHFHLGAACTSAYYIQSIPCLPTQGSSIISGFWLSINSLLSSPFSILPGMTTFTPSVTAKPASIGLPSSTLVRDCFLDSGTSDVSSTNHTRSTASPLHTLVLMLAHRLRFWSCPPVYIHSLPCSPVLSLLLAYSTLLLSFLLSILSSWLLPWGLGPAVLSASREQCVCLSHFRSAAAGGCLWLAVLFNASLALLLFISHLLRKVTCLFIIRKEAVSRLFSQLYLRAQKDMWLKSTHFCNLLSEQVL